MADDEIYVNYRDGLSAIGLVTVIPVILLYAKYKDLRNFNHNLVVLSCFSVTIGNLAYVVPNLTNSIGGCVSKLFFAIIGDVGQILWLSSISVTLHFVLRGPPCSRNLNNFYPDDHKKFYHIVIWTVCLFVSLGQSLPEAFAFPHYDNLARCVLSVRNLKDQAITRVFGLDIFWVILFVYLVWNSIMVRRQLIQMEEAANELTSSSSETSQMTLKNLKRLYVYPLIVCIYMLVSILNRTLIVVGADAAISRYFVVTLRLLLTFAESFVFLTTPAVSSKIKQIFKPKSLKNEQLLLEHNNTHS